MLTLLGRVGFYELSNLLEAGLWIAIGLAFLPFAIRRTGVVRQRCLIAVVVFVCFGLSDVAEANVGTGAWWDPWWLFIWKAMGVLSLLALLVDYILRRRRQRR